MYQILQIRTILFPKISDWLWETAEVVRFAKKTIYCNKKLFTAKTFRLEFCFLMTARDLLSS